MKIMDNEVKSCNIQSIYNVLLFLFVLIHMFDDDSAAQSLNHWDVTKKQNKTKDSGALMLLLYNSSL